VNTTELAREVEARTGTKAGLVKRVLQEAGYIVADTLEEGEDVTINGLVKFSWRYRKGFKKGERYKKGTTYTGFGGVEVTADADSPARTAQIKLAVSPLGDINKIKPRKSNMQDFLKSKAGKAIAKRKS